MRKLIAIGTVILMVLSIAALSYADDRSEDKTISVQLQVDSVFGFTVWDSQLDQILEPYGEPYPDPQDPAKTIDPRLGSLNMTVDTNRGVAWYLLAASTGLVPHLGPSVPIPLVIVTFEGPANPLMGWLTPAEGIELKNMVQWIIYASASGPEEESVSSFEVPAIFQAKPGIPIPQGTYEGIIQLTMTEQ